MATVEQGASVSHYRVIGPLGAGGMGEVYKAQDTTLERVVALKILPPDLVRNEERVRRFVQEAKSASSLNHPNIVTIHEIGQATVDDAPLHYIAMELVDGFTLRRKIHEEKTDLRTLLEYLAQAADGLAKAHAAGIVHRDLKPENIMITRDGFAKVLDFGLAKLSIKQSSPDATTEATEARQVTREGVVMGTVAYMSPEQVHGKVVDSRSDIFSFGCILYEAATRRRPFQADSDFELMHRIANEKPQPVDEINPNVPSEVRRMIRRCLAKDPEKRYQSMKDIALELSEIVAEFDELSASATSASKSGAVAVQKPRRGVWIVVPILIIVLAAAGYVAWHQTRTTSAPPVSYQSMKIQRLAAPAQGEPSGLTISPDAKYAAFIVKDAAGQRSVWVRQIATGSDVQVVPPSKTAFGGIAFSPDGNYLYYVHAEKESGAGYSSLYQIPTLGGSPRKLLFDVDTAPSFSPDGRQLAFTRGDLAKNLYYLVLANADGTGERIVTSYKRLGALVTPSWAPDGKSIAVVRVDLNGGPHSVPAAIDVATGKEQPIGTVRWNDMSDLRWLPDGSGLIVRASDPQSHYEQLWLLPYPAGEAARVTNDLSDYGLSAVAADGKTLATMRFDSSTDLVSIDPRTNAEKTLPQSARTRYVLNLFVTDSGSMLMELRDEKGSDIATNESMLTSDGHAFAPVATADGRTIYFTSDRASDRLPHVFMIDADGSNLRQITRGTGEGGQSISADGRTLIYFTIDARLMRANGDGSGAVQALERASSAVISPDGSKIAYTYIVHTGNRDEPRFAVIPLTGGKPLLDIPQAGGGTLRWRKSSDGVSYIRVVDGVSQVFLQRIDGTPATQVTHFKDGWIGGHDWTRDGQLIVSQGHTRGEMLLISDFR